MNLNVSLYNHSEQTTVLIAEYHAEFQQINHVGWEMSCGPPPSTYLAGMPVGEL